jgi:hypothetical protein
MPLKHNHRYTSEKKTHPYKNIMQQAPKVRDHIQVGVYRGYWAEMAVKKEAALMRDIRNKMRADCGLPPID